MQCVRRLVVYAKRNHLSFPAFSLADQSTSTPNRKPDCRITHGIVRRPFLPFERSVIVVSISQVIKVMKLQRNGSQFFGIHIAKRRTEAINEKTRCHSCFTSDFKRRCITRCRSDAAPARYHPDTLFKLRRSLSKQRLLRPAL